jgi:hypothetical protein
MGNRMCGPRGGRWGKFDWDNEPKAEPTAPTE